MSKISKEKLEAVGISTAQPQKIAWKRRRQIYPNRVTWALLRRVAMEMLENSRTFPLTAEEIIAIGINPDVICEVKPKISKPRLVSKDGRDGKTPKGFVPLPDVEIGGCARNDSLIAPAI